MSAATIVTSLLRLAATAAAASPHPSERSPDRPTTTTAAATALAAIGLTSGRITASLRRDGGRLINAIVSNRLLLRHVNDALDRRCIATVISRAYRTRLIRTGVTDLIRTRSWHSVGNAGRRRGCIVSHGRLGRVLRSILRSDHRCGLCGCKLIGRLWRVISRVARPARRGAANDILSERRCAAAGDSSQRGQRIQQEARQRYGFHRRQSPGRSQLRHRNRAANWREFFRLNSPQVVNRFCSFLDRLRKHSCCISHAVSPTCVDENEPDDQRQTAQNGLRKRRSGFKRCNGCVECARRWRC